MKLYVKRNEHNEIILGMATAKSELIKNLKSRSPSCISHIVKWYVYIDNDARFHWKKEISSYLAYASSRKLKGGKKLNKQDVIDSLLYPVHDGDESDARSILQDFIWDVARKEHYPEFELSRDLIKQFSLFLQEFVRTSVPMIVEKHAYEISEFYPVLDACYNKYPRPDYVEFY